MRQGALLVVGLAACRFGFTDNTRRDGAINDGIGDDVQAGGDDADVVPADAPVDVVVSTLCPNAVPITTGTKPSLAWSGSKFGVAYSENNNLKFVAFDAAGNLAASPITLGPSSISGGITSLGGNFYPAWDGSGVQVAEVSSAGALVAGPVTISTSGWEPRIANNGIELRVAWEEYVNKQQIFTSPVASDLSGVSKLQLTNLSYDSGAPTVTNTSMGWAIPFDGSKLKMSCVDHSLYFQGVKTTGQAAGNAVISYDFICDNSGNAESHHGVADWNGSDVSVAWSGIASDPSHIYLARLDPGTGAVVGSPVVVSSSAGTEPAMVWAGTELGLSWTGNGIILTRTSAAGTGTSDTAISSAGRHSSVDWDGTGYGVVWEDAGTIYYAHTCP